MSSFQRRQTRSTYNAVTTPTLTLYVLECEDDCWYVGITGNMNRRWNEHCGRGGATWTKRHRPIEIHSTRSIAEHIAKKEESKLTAQLMFKHGINRVRGGPLTWSRDYTTSDNDLRIVAGSIRKALDLDYSETRQWVIDQLENKSDSYQSPVSAVRTRQDDTFDEVGALQGLFGRVTIRTSTSSSSSCCDRCGRNKHTRSACYARTHLDGWRIYDDGCEKCGRDSHTVDNCYARTDRYGNSF